MLKIEYILIIGRSVWCTISNNKKFPEMDSSSEAGERHELSIRRGGGKPRNFDKHEKFQWFEDSPLK